MSFIDHGALYNPKLQSIKQLPDQCAKHRTFNADYQHRPVIDLDIVWNAFSQYYGFFALRGISAQQWRAKYEQFKTRALHTKNAKQLFSLLSELLEYAAGEKNVQEFLNCAPQAEKSLSFFYADVRNPHLKKYFRRSCAIILASNTATTSDNMPYTTSTASILIKKVGKRKT